MAKQPARKHAHEHQTHDHHSEDGSANTDADDDRKLLANYRGHSIETQGRGEHLRLKIDGMDIDVRQTESGVLSHAAMFREFSNVFELAEELIKQWGDAKIENPSFGPQQHHH